MIKIKIYIFIFISISTIIKSSNIISFQFQYFYNHTLKNPYSIYLNNLYNSYIYSNAKIGQPQYDIKTLFFTESRYYSLVPKLENIEGKNISSYYNINNSDTFQNISALNKYYVFSKKDIAAKEKFIFNVYNLEEKTNNEIIINDLDFILGVRNKIIELNNFIDIYELNIGLELMNSQTEKFNFINLLKERSIINDYNWFLSFEKIKRNNDSLYYLDDIINVKGKLLIGCLPHNYNPNLYLKDNTISVYSWMLDFKNIYYFINDTNYNSGMKKQEIPALNRKAEISINEFLIIAPIQYQNLIKYDYFTNYIAKNICHYYYDSDIEGFYCDKSENFTINNLKSFPTLYFEHNIFNYTFELSYKDLFIEKDDKYFFLIVVENGDVDDWYFGYIFLKKYQFSFDQDAKRITFYNQDSLDNEEKDNNENKGKNNNKSNNDKKEKMNYLAIILVIISWIIFIGVGIILGTFIYKKCYKKKRANELNDDYEYISESNNNNIN